MSNIRKNSKYSFTLIEVLIVVAVVAILSSIFIIRADRAPEARDAKRRAEIANIRNTLWAASDVGTSGYPATDELDSGTRATCCLGTGDPYCATVEAVLGSVPKDPLFTAGNKENCYYYKSDGTTFDLYVKLETGGVLSLSESSVNQVSATSNNCGTGWINTGLGFCVMKYEAKCPTDDDGYDGCSDSNPVPTSRPGGTPWGNVTQIQAVAACKSIGAHLINNVEWMAIARDVESVADNWNGTVMYRGHSDGQPIMPLSISVPDPDLDDGYNQTGESAPSDQRRALVLSNGQIIWDFAGNVWDNVDYVVDGVGTQPQYPLQLGSYDYYEIGTVTNFGNTFGYDNIGPANHSLNSSNGIGTIDYRSDEPDTRSLQRGGWVGDHDNAGAFAVDFYQSPGLNSPYIGFRCAK